MDNDDFLNVHNSWSIFGHEWAVRLLQRAMGVSTADGRLQGPRHAYLFLGPGQVGKTTLARAFARALLCTGVEPWPCESCRSCQLMARESHPDFRLLQPLDKDGHVDRANGTLRVEQASTLIHEAVLRPLESRYKVFVIQDAHTANDSFANKLLKTLEEPPDHVIICLTALDRASLLPTIVSRCQTLELRPLPAEVISHALREHWQANAEQAELLARLSNGRLGWAIRQLNDTSSGERRNEQLNQLLHLIEANRIERLDFAERLSAGRDNQQLFEMLASWTTWWRDVLLAQSGCLDSCSNIDQKAELRRQAEGVSATAVQDYLRTLYRIEGYLHHTVNTRLALDVLLLQLPHLRAASHQPTND